MSLGESLKKSLGLEKFKYILVTRALITTYKVYLVFIDSRHPNSPLTTGMVLRKPMPSMLFTYPFKDQPILTPLFNIEDFNATPTLSMFFVIDISGNYGNPSMRDRFDESVVNEDFLLNYPEYKKIIIAIRDNYKTLSKEELINKLVKQFNYSYKDMEGIYNDALSKPKQLDKIKEDYNYIFIKGISKILEGLTIPDLKANAVSDRNKDFLAQRRKEGQSGSYLQWNKIKWNEAEDIVILEWKVVPSFDKLVTNFEPDGEETRKKMYTVRILFENVSKYIGTKKGFELFTPKEQGELTLGMLDNAECKLYSSDPSFLFQSSWEYLDDAGAAIYPLPTPRGKGIWAARHGNTAIEGLHLTKHTLEILQYIKNSYQIITKELGGR